MKFTTELYKEKIVESSRFEAEEETSMLSQPMLTENSGSEPLCSTVTTASPNRPQKRHQIATEANTDPKRRKLNPEARQNREIQLSPMANRVQEPSTAPKESERPNDRNGSSKPPSSETQSTEDAEPQVASISGLSPFSECLSAKIKEGKLKRVIQEPTAHGPRTILEFQ